MLVRRTASTTGSGLVARTCSKPAPSGCLPSVDPMFASLAETCEGRALGVVLSGMGRDGLDGARVLVEAGGRIIAQDAETSAVWGMPGAVAKAGLASVVAAPHELARTILDAARPTRASQQR
jgi:two-component system chemotaxis response regulator CheB